MAFLRFTSSPNAVYVLLLLPILSHLSCTPLKLFIPFPPDYRVVALLLLVFKSTPITFNPFFFPFFFFLSSKTKIGTAYDEYILDPRNERSGDSCFEVVFTAVGFVLMVNMYLIYGVTYFENN